MSRPPLSLDRLTPDQRRLFELRRRQRGISARPLVRIPRRPAGGELAECSSGQQRFWFLEQLDGGAGTFNVVTAVRLRGRLDRHRLAADLGRVAERHEILRTTFHLLNGRLAQRIHPRLPPEVSLLDVAGCPCPELAARDAVAAAACLPFDLARGPLLRLALLRLGDQEHLALVTLHHSVADGWSLGVLVRELAAAYGAASPGAADLPELPIQYADFACWQRAELAAGAFDLQLAGWRRRLAGAPDLELPTDRPRGTVGTGGAGGPASTLELPSGGAAALRELAQAEGATLFMALCAAFAFLLARLAGQREVVVGTPVAGRGPAETHDLIGLFLNTLALRLDLGGDPSLRQLIGRAREVTLAAFADQDLPFDRLVEEIAPERQLGRSPLFQAMLSTQGATVPRVEMSGLLLEPTELDRSTLQVDLSLSFEESDLGGRPRLALAYRRDLFDCATVERWGGHLVRWIAAAAAAPDRAGAELDLLSAPERHQLLQEWNDTAVAEDGLFLHELFEAQAARHPEAVALVHPGGELSYGALDRRASELAAVLRGLGVGPEALVAVCLGRSPELLVALLAVWKAGGAYLPLDPALPRERRRTLLADAGPAVLVTRRALAEELREPADATSAVLLDEPLPALPAPAGPPALCPDSLAWVMYTSGSTGAPNGVLVPHRGAVPLLRCLAEVFRMTPASRILQVTSVGFDVSLAEMFLALANGGCLCQVTEEERLSPGALAERLEQRGVDTVVCTPSFLDLLPEPRLPGVRVVAVGGEACPAALAERWSRGRRLVDCYGPTEATIYATLEVLEDVSRLDRPPAIGRPLPGTAAYVLDAGLVPVPPGAPGELALGGIGLARGYLERPHLTAERFVPNPFAAAAGARQADRNGGLGARLYRTGDRVRRRPDGRLEFLGRLDHQVKIRGVRIELGEIEAVLRGHPAVLAAAVLAPQRAPLHAGMERRLLAWVVPQPGREAAPAELRRFLEERLPAAMVPAQIVPLDALPVTGTGKLDRKALERRAVEIGAEARSRTAPRTPAERLVAGLWQEVLKLPEVGVDENFFALGGSSIQAAILNNRLEEALGERVWVAALFNAPTVERLTTSLLATCPAGMARAIGEGAVPPHETAQPPLPLRRRVHAGPPPLSFAQERLWFLDRLEHGSPAYVIPAAVRLRGGLDVAALAASLAEVVRRHAVLRTRFGLVDGRPVQIVDEPVRTPPALPLIDLAGLGAGAEAEAGRRAAAEAVRPFDLAAGTPLRSALLRLGCEEHAVLVSLHHIAGDAWSIGVLVSEMAALYPAFAARRPSPLPELPVQYTDFAVWQREQLAGEELARQLAWWRERLAGAPLVLELPADRPRPSVQSFRGAAVTAPLPPELAAGLAALGARGGEGVTPFMTLLAGFQALLGRVTGQGTLLVGSTIANRTRRELEGLIGFFVNTLVLRADLAAGARFATHLARVRAEVLGAFLHQDLPLELLVEELRPPRDLGRAPLVQVIFQMQNAPAAALELPGLSLEPLPVQAQTAKFDLVVSVVEQGGGMALTWGYSTGLFDRATVARLAGHFTALLAGAVEDPDRRLGDLPLLGAGERHQVVVECNAGFRSAGDPGVLHRRFGRVAAARPEAVAAVCGAGRWSYGELAARARRLAWALARAGVRPGDRVGVFLERSLELVAAVVGVVECGAAYVPVDPAYPAERVAFVLADSGVKAVVSERGLEGGLTGLPEGVEMVWAGRMDGDSAAGAEPLLDDSVPASPAYVTYTSGSTGRPKGVEVSHGQVGRLFESTAEWFRFGPADVWTLFHSIAFDFSVWELWGPLLTGGRLVVVPYEMSRSPEAFYGLLAREGVTVLNQTPSAFRQLIWAEEAVRARDPELPVLRLREVIFGGEALEPASLAPWVDRHGDGLESGGPRLVNMYGITETTVHVTFRPLSAAEVRGGVGSVLGVPIPDLAVYLVDRQLQPVPLGVPGEIVVGGAGVASGYLGRPDLTAERFVPDPFGHQPGMRLYRSGDLARRRPPYLDKDLEYLGRIDHQVKIRGFRIELGEIEAALSALPGVREAAVLVREEGGEKRLVAYVAGEEGELPDLAAARALLAETLPDYMLPSALVRLPALPLTAHGKVDRRALPAPGAAPAMVGEAPRTALERDLAALFAEVLRTEAVGVDDDFFELGGNSISGAVLINRLQQEVDEIVHVVAIFDAPTVRRLAAYLGSQHRDAVRRRWGASSLDEAAGESGGRPGTVDRAAVERLRGLIPAPSWPVRSRVHSLEKNPRAVFILSPPRSGSTLLRVMLAGHPALFAPPELELLGFDTLAERSAAFAGPRDSFWLEGAVRAVMAARGCGVAEARGEIAAAERAGLTTLELYGRLQSWLGGRTLVDKTPSYALSRAVLERAEEGFEEPFYIHLLRHPLGMIQSFEEAKLDQIFLRRAGEGPAGFGRRALAELIWVVSQENIRDFLAGIPAARRHELRFEDLVRDPAGTLAALCAALGLAYEPAMARPYEEGDQGARMTDGLHAASRMLGDVKFHQHRGIDAAAAERWRTHRRMAELGEVTRDLARALGYEAGPAAGEPAAVRIAPGTWVPGSPAPLSFAQERLWFLDRLEPGSPAYHLTAALRLTGALDLAALDAAMAGVIRRHAALRTTFSADLGGPVQRVAEAAAVAGLRWPVVDLAALPAPRQEEAAGALSRAEARRPFDLAAGPLLRTLLLRLGAREHAAIVVQHHIVSDGWSMGIFARELVALYAAAVAGVPTRLPALPVQYPDFAVWQRRHLDGPALAGQLAWWRERLAGAPQVLELPFDRPRASSVMSAGRTRAFPPLSGPLTADLAALGRRHGASLFMTLFAGFSALLARAGNQPDLVVGSPIAGRNRAEIEGLIGFFVNALALRADLRGEPGFRALLGQVRETVLGAFAHQDLPFEKLVADLAPERTLQAAPLFQVMFALQNLDFQGAGEDLAAPGLAVRALATDTGAAKFDLVLGLYEIHQAPGGIRGTWGYRTDLFDGATVERLGRHLATLLAAVAEDSDRPLSDLPLLGAAERQALLVEWNDPVGQEPRSGFVHRLVAAQAARRPAAPAVVDGATGAVQTYGELAARAGRLARRLRALGVGPETPVGVYLDRCLDLPAVLLGVLASGATYLPLDPAYPSERLAFLLADATQGSGQATPVLTRAGLRDDVAAILPGARIEVIEPLLAASDPEGDLLAAEGPEGLDPENGAYVIYTSGSTGTPKGVVVSHRALANRMLYLADVLTADGSLLHKAAIGFDLSLSEILGPLTAGGRVVLVPPGGVQDSSEMLRVIAEHRLTHVAFTTPALAVLLDDPGFDAAFRTVRNVGVGGEAVPAELVERFLRRHGAELWNRYGPTETTISITAWRCRPGERGLPPIGRPVAAAALYVLDRLLRPVPPGVAGEICIGGVCVARGYLARPGLTAAAFCPDPHAGVPGTQRLPSGARDRSGGARLYRTGDLGRFRADGALEFLGRLDRQVKVRGFRVELGEIESALLRHPAVREAAVVDRADGATRSLVAFVTAAADPSALAAADLREALGRSLPAWMVPAAFVTLPALPIAPTGKVDRRALAELAREETAEAADETAETRGPLAEIEELIAGIWQELLGVRRVRPEDDFFALGGHSLLATQLVLRLRAMFGVEVPLRAVFEAPTLAEMAAALAAYLQSQAGDEAEGPPLVTHSHAG